METLDTVGFTLLFVAWLFTTWQAYEWRKRAQSAEAFINNPNVKAVDKETAYKDSFEAKVNALEDERRDQHETLMEAFDYLNDHQPFGSHNDGLMQIRNKLMTSIQLSTYGRE